MQIEKSLFYQRILFIAFWIRAVWAFFAEEVAPFAASLQPLVYLAFDAVIVALGLVMMSRKRDKIYAVVFIAIGLVITCLLNELSLFFYINGLRDFISLLFIIPIMDYFLREPERRERFVADFDRQLFWFLVLQVPCVLYQFFVYGAGDHGGGSLGNGSSGIISTLIFVISFYLIKKRMDPERYVASLWENKIYILLLIPTQLNETKISFFFIIMYFLLLLPLNKKLFIRLLFAIPFMILVTWIAIMGYMAILSDNPEAANMFDLDYMSETYLLDDGDMVDTAEALYLADSEYFEGADIPRFTKIIYLATFNDQYPGHMWTGMGIGHFKGGTMVKTSKFYKDNEWMLGGTIIYVVFLIVQLGLIGVVLALWFFWNLFSAPEKGLKRDYNMQIFMILMFVLLIVYNESLRYEFMMIPMVYAIWQSWYEGADAEVTDENTDEVEPKPVSTQS